MGGDYAGVKCQEGLSLGRLGGGPPQLGTLPHALPAIPSMAPRLPQLSCHLPFAPCFSSATAALSLLPLCFVSAAPCAWAAPLRDESLMVCFLSSSFKCYLIRAFLPTLCKCTIVRYSNGPRHMRTRMQTQATVSGSSPTSCTLSSAHAYCLLPYSCM